jgi:hypothetical protein
VGKDRSGAEHTLVMPDECMSARMAMTLPSPEVCRHVGTHGDGF